MADPTTQFFIQFAVAAGIGGLVGIEREHRPDHTAVVAGVRTFPLISISGFLLGVLTQETTSPFVLMAGVLGAFGMAFMLMHLRQTLGQTGITTPMAMIVTFLLGVIVSYDYLLQAVAIGVATTFLLVTKERLHRFANFLDNDEILSALQFITLVFILLPLTADLPDQIYGQWWLGRGALVDPYFVLLIVVFVSSISFASLIAMREIGPRRGLEFSGLLGGLVNSEATTAGLAQRARDEEALLQPALVGIILASTTMLGRNLAIIAFADPSLALAKAIAPYLVPVALVGAFYGLRLRSGRGPPIPPVRVKNPFAVGPALRFAVIFSIVSIVTQLARDNLGESGVYVAALGGFVSAGAVVASMAGLEHAGTLSLDLALRVSMLAMAASVFGKLFIVRAVNPDMMRRAAVPLAAMTLVALIAVGVAFVLGA